MAFTGLRSSELRGLRWKDIDVKASQLHVRQRADRYNKIGAPKSEKSVRTLPLDTITLDALREWKLKSPHSKPDDYVFGTKTGHIISQDKLLDALILVMKTARLTNKEGIPFYGLHALRHFSPVGASTQRIAVVGNLPPGSAELLGHNHHDDARYLWALVPKQE